MNRKHAVELLAVAVVAVVLAVLTVSSVNEKLPVALAQNAGWQAPEQDPPGLFGSPLLRVGGYNGQQGPFHSPLVSAGTRDAQGGGDLPANSLARLYAEYLPWIVRLDDNRLSSTIFLQNTSAAEPTLVVVKFYDLAGTLVHPLTDTIPANGSLMLEQATMPELPVGFEGGAVVESDGPVLAVVNLATDSRDRLLSYNGVPEAERDVTLPLVTRNAAGLDTSLWIQNASPVTSSVSVTYHSYEGGPGCEEESVDLPPFASFVLDQARPLCIGDGFFGLASIQAGEPVAAVAVLWGSGSNGASAYEGPTPAILVPGLVLPYRQLVPRQEKKSWSSSVLIANLSVLTANVDANWYSGDGSGSWHDARAVPEGGRIEYYLPEVAGIPDGFDGSLVADADQPIALMSNWAIRSEAGDGFATNPGLAVYGGGPAPGSDKVHLPRVAHGPGMSTHFSVQNAAELEAMAFVTITYHAPGGAISAVVEDAIPHKGVTRFNSQDVVALGSEWEGTATIRSSQPIVVEVMQFLWHYSIHLPLVRKGTGSR